MSEERITMTVGEASQQMNVSAGTVRDLCRKGYLDAAKFGRSWQISAESVQQWIVKPILPPKPFYQRHWFLALSAIVFLLAGIFSALNDSGIRSSVYSIFQPPPFAAEQEGEVLIVVATFYRTEGVMDVDVHGEIARAIKDRLKELVIDNVRVEIEPTAIEPTSDVDANRAAAEKLGERYKATLIIWGADTGVRVKVDFLNLKEPDSFAAEVNISETQRTQLASPEKYSQLVVDELPTKLSFLSLFAVGQMLLYDQNQYEKAIHAIQAATALVIGDDIIPDEFEISSAFALLKVLYEHQAQTDKMSITTHQLDPQPHSLRSLDAARETYMFLLSPEASEEALISLDYAITLNPHQVHYYIYRAYIYISLGDYDSALTNYDSAIAIDPEDVFTYRERASMHYELKHWQSALMDYQRYLVLRPDASDRESVGLRIAELEELLRK